MLLNIPTYAYTLANAVFFKGCYSFGGGSWGGVGRALHRHKNRSTRVYIGKRWCFGPITLYNDMEYGPKFAVHYTKLLRKNGQWGGERGGVSYILIRFMIRDSESTRLRTKGPGGLVN